MAEIVTPDGPIRLPEDAPEDVARAVRIAEATRFCRFTSDLIPVLNGKEFMIDAEIGPERLTLGAFYPRRYRVRFLIPRGFPYRTAHAIPIDPALRWYPHQNGNWPRENYANVICPPRQSEIRLDQLLAPHVRHAYSWITDALEGNLTPPDQRYEFPHIVKQSGRRAKVYAEGGASTFEWLSAARYGRVKLSRISNSGFADGLFRAVEFRSDGAAGSGMLPSQVRDGFFGSEEEAGWAPWVFVGNPVVEEPHRPPVTWDDFSNAIQRRIVMALRSAWGRNAQAPILLLAFGVPEFWGGTAESVVWQAVYLEGLETNPFEGARRHPSSYDPMKLRRVQDFLERNRSLGWISCADISREALTSRGGIGSRGDLSSTRVALLGIGAVGSIWARGLARFDPARLVMVDRDLIEPGNLVRHEAHPFQVEQNKAVAGAALLPTLRNAAIGLGKDVISDWKEIADHIADCDVVVDATGDAGVNEFLSVRPELADKAVVWCYVKPGPDFGVLVLRRPGSNTTLEQAEARLQGVVATGIWERFEGGEGVAEHLVWPEPGCFFPTFEAPHHRLTMMCEAFLTVFLSWLGKADREDVVTLFRQDQRQGQFGFENWIEAQVGVS